MISLTKAIVNNVKMRRKIANCGSVSEYFSFLAIELKKGRTTKTNNATSIAAAKRSHTILKGLVAPLKQRTLNFSLGVNESEIEFEVGSCQIHTNKNNS
jgi:molybdenum cofactor biosynthesis enzyme